MNRMGADKLCEFIAEAQYRSCQTPSPNHFRLNFVSLFAITFLQSRIDAKQRAASMIKPKNPKAPGFDRTSPIRQDKTKPAPGDYQDIDAYKKT